MHTFITIKHSNAGIPKIETDIKVIGLIGIIRLSGSIITLYAYNKKKLTVIRFKYLKTIFIILSPVKFYAI